MSDDKRYFKVGAFVLTGALLIGSFTVILGGGDYFAEKVVIETYFDESVQGLEVGSPVKLRGVQVGSVSSIGFVRTRTPSRPRSRRSDTAPRCGCSSIWTPRTQGIDEEVRRYQLHADDQEGPAPSAHLQRDHRHFLHRGRLSRRRAVSAHGHHVAAQALLHPVGAQHDRDDLKSAAERLFARLENTEIEKLVQNLDKFVVNLNSSVDEFDAAELQRDLQVVLAEARTMVAGINRLVDGSSYDLQASLDNTRVATENLRDLTDTLKSYPSLLVLGDPPNPPAVSAK